jgi:hypothetical protein
MDWGDAPGWAGAGLGLAAFAVSLVSVKHSRRSADAAVESADAAKESVRLTRRSSDAAERSATAAEEMLADQRRAATEQRAAEAEAARPRVDLAVQYRDGNLFELVNYGHARAENVRLAEEDPAVSDWPAGVSLGHLDVSGFMMSGGMAWGIPAVLKVVWDGQTDPVSLLVPPHAAR